MTRPRCGFVSLRLARIADHRCSALLTQSLACFMLLIAASSVCAQTDSSEQNEGWIAVITADRVPLRCGANDTYYPLGTVERGTLVKVVGEKLSWARIAAVGPAFDDLFGHVKYTEAQSGRFSVAGDGRTGRTLGRVEVLAPNINEKAHPLHSWRPVARLGADETLDIIETTREGEEIVHKVRLPEQATVWVSMAQLQRASAAQEAQWRAALARTPDQRMAAKDPQALPERPARQPQDSATTPEKVAPSSSGDLPTLGSLDSDLPATATKPAATEKPSTGQPALARESQDLPIVRGPDLTLADDARTVGQKDDRPEGVPLKTLRRQESEPRVELKSLEVAFDALSKEEIENAELRPLQNLYLEYADRVAPDFPRMASYARARAEQLEIWRSLQDRKRELATLRARIDRAGDDADQVSRALRGTGSYTAVGRLTASTIYDGSRLPKLLRLQDPGTGRTVAYLELDREFDLTGMLGQLIGIMGERAYDPALRLNLITPRRIDLLAPQMERDAAVLSNTAPPATMTN